MQSGDRVVGAQVLGGGGGMQRVRKDQQVAGSSSTAQGRHLRQSACRQGG